MPGFIRALIKTAREAVDAGVDKALGPEPQSSVHPDTPLPPQPMQDPLTPMQDCVDERQGGTGASRDGRGADGGGAGARGPLGRLNLIIAMTQDAEQREVHAMRSAAQWGVTLVIVGLIFLILTATGVTPTSVDNLKSIGVYDDYIINYCLYMVAGAAGLGAAATGRRALRAGRATTPEQAAFLLAGALALATIGISIWLDVKVNDFDSLSWFSWVILVFIVFQRGVFAIACGLSFWTLRLHAAGEGQGPGVGAGGYAAGVDTGKAGVDAV